jgi:hypothetical protein
MAKRLKLNNQELENIQNLKNDMTKVAKTKKGPAAEKNKKYEELLAEYRQSLENFKKREPDHEFIEYVAEKVLDLLKLKGTKFNGKWSRLINKT